jgi:TonB family protein
MLIPHATLSRRERQIMDVLYRKESATAAEVMENMPDPPSYSTVRALLRILDQKGQVKHEENAGKYVFMPTVRRDKAKLSALRHLVQTFFDGSTEDAGGRIAGFAVFKAVGIRVGPSTEADRQGPQRRQEMSFALDIIVKTAVILAAPVVICILLRRASASSRHALWALAIVSVLLLPFAAAIVPQLQLPVLPVPGANAARMPATIAISAVAVQAAQHASRVPLVTTLVVLWALGAAAVIGRLLAGAVGIRRLSKFAHRSEDGTWDEITAQTAAQYELHKPLRLLFSDAEVLPVTWGVLRHTVLLPSSAERWSFERRRLVLAHEMAHVQRNDGILHLLSQLACGIHWFNPLIWHAARRERIERERACDDQVLSHVGAPMDYAEHLVQIVRGLQARRALSAAALGMAQPSQLEARLVSILDSHARREPVSKSGVVLLCTAVGLMTLLIAGIRVTGSVPLPPILAVATKPVAAPEAETKAVSAPPQRTRMGNEGAVTSSAIIPPRVLETSGTLYAAVEGTVTLEASVGVQGNVHVLRVVKTPNSDLDTAAIAAVESWKFAPALKDGVPVAAISQVDVDFRLPGEAIRIGPDVTPPTVMSRVEPKYTDEAKEARAQGTVVLQVVIRKDGSVDVLRVVRSIGYGLDQSSIDAFKQWVFRPGMKNGNPVDVALNVEINFNLK